MRRWNSSWGIQHPRYLLPVQVLLMKTAIMVIGLRIVCSRIIRGLCEFFIGKIVLPSPVVKIAHTNVLMRSILLETRLS